MKTPTHDQPKIQDYGIVGDCRSAALVSRQGSIDWLCWPRFDSPAIFAAILDPEVGGSWSMTPIGPFTGARKYVEDTNVLVTNFHGPSGEGHLTDLMPVASEKDKRGVLLPDHELIREFRCTEGELQVEIRFNPRAGYGAKAAKIRDFDKLGLRVEVGRGAYWLRSNVRLSLGSEGARAIVTLRQGDQVRMSLSYSEESPAVLPLLDEEFDRKIERSIRWWQHWSKGCTYQGRYRETVVRSALALKLLSYAPSGAITAAATTSLPEIVGGALNWDYRYCWLRDASLTVRALLGLGYREEAESFLTWLLNATRMTQPKLRAMYTLFGEIAPRERELERLSGYMESSPVRIGNGARNQLQMDIYGEVIEAAAQYARSGGRFDGTTQKILVGIGKYVAANWDQPDEGIWEARSARQHHTYSRLMCWTALDRLLELHDAGAVESGPFEEFKIERKKIEEQIRTRAWNESLQSYAATLDGNDLDATLLRLPWHAFEKPDSERMRKTHEQVRTKLGVGDHLMYRYERTPAEGAFGICGFWEVEYLAIGGGTIEEANTSFQHLLRYRNDLGLFSEEIDPVTGDALGNFPQAFTHVGLISAALSIEERENGESHPAEHRQKNGKSEAAA